MALIRIFNRRQFCIRSTYPCYSDESGKRILSIITVNAQWLYKHVYKYIYFYILTQTHGAGKSHLHKGVNFCPTFNHLSHIYGT